MLKLTLMISDNGSYLGNQYLKLQVHWSDGDSWLPERRSIERVKNGYYNLTTTCTGDLVLLLSDVVDTVELDTINLFVDELELPKLKRQLLQANNQVPCTNKKKLLQEITTCSDEQARVKQFFSNPKVNVTVY